MVAALFTEIAHSGDGVMFNCSAGRDRTGLVTAMLLRFSGVPTAAIVDDYELGVRDFNDWVLATPGPHPEFVERKGEARSAELRCVPQAPVRTPQRPSGLHPPRVGAERVLGGVPLPNPRFVRQESVELTPVLIDRGAGPATAADDLTGRALVGDPLVNAVMSPRHIDLEGPVDCLSR